jgi:hypothetical protein
VSIFWSVRSAANTYTFHGAVGDPDDFARRVAIQYR